MSEQTALEFIRKANTDAALKKQIQGAGNDLKMILQVASNAGFDFMPEEFVAATKKLGENGLAIKLSDEELDRISGGTGTRNDTFMGC